MRGAVTWTPCAAGCDDGRVLLVPINGGLVIAVKRWREPGTYMTEISAEQLRELLGVTIAHEMPSQSGDQIAPDTAEPAEKQPD